MPSASQVGTEVEAFEQPATRPRERLTVAFHGGAPSSRIVSAINFVYGRCQFLDSMRESVCGSV